jgi:hypothetical protein
VNEKDSATSQTNSTEQSKRKRQRKNKVDIYVSEIVDTTSLELDRSSQRSMEETLLFSMKAVISRTC